MRSGVYLVVRVGCVVAVGFVRAVRVLFWASAFYPNRVGTAGGVASSHSLWYTGAIWKEHMAPTLKAYRLSMEGRTQILTTGLLISPVDVFKVTARMMLSVPACSSMIRPICHFKGGVASSFTKTRTPIWRSCWWFCFHFTRCCRCVTYSLFHLDQKCWSNCWWRWKRDSWFSRRWL